MVTFAPGLDSASANSRFIIHAVLITSREHCHQQSLCTHSFYVSCNTFMSYVGCVSYVLPLPADLLYIDLSATEL